MTDKNNHPRKTYYTNVPGWASKQVEDYIEKTGFSNSKAVAKLVQKGLQEQSFAERMIRQMVAVPLTLLAIFITVYSWVAVGGLIGIPLPIDTTTATVYATIIVPAMVSTAAVFAMIIHTGYARKVGTKLSGGES